MLVFNVRYQTINRIDSFLPAEKSIHYLLARFDFKRTDWAGAIKTAVFQNPSDKKEYDAILDDDCCVVPWEAISEDGKCKVSVYGLTEDYKITTGIEEFKINPTLHGGSASQEPTPSVYEQLLERLSHIDGGKFTDWSE